MRTNKTTALMAILFIPAIWGCDQDPAGPEGPQDGALASAFTQDPYLTITPGLMELGVGEEGHFSAEIAPLHATGPAPENIRWISMDPAIATVDADGTVHALGRGMARIRAEADDFLDEAWVRVR